MILRPLASLSLVAVLATPGCRRSSPSVAVAQNLAPRLMTPEEYESWARAQFRRNHPGKKPLNWAIAEAVRRFYRDKPMGKFVLGVGPGTWGNDCSDFVACAMDEGLGVKARFTRGSRDHLLAERAELWETFYWSPGVAVQPGDAVHVLYSPHYPRGKTTYGHVGLIGPDGMVYDFTKLRNWRSPRYGRHSFSWFTHNSLDPQETIIVRLAPRYRYCIEPLPPVAPVSP